MKIYNQRPQKLLNNNFQVNLIKVLTTLDISPLPTLRVHAINFFGLILKIQLLIIAIILAHQCSATQFLKNSKKNAIFRGLQSPFSRKPDVKESF